MNKVKFLLPFLLLCVGVIQAQNYQWAKRLAGSGSFDVNVKRVAAIPGQGVYVCGSFSGTVDFDPNATVSNKTANSIDGFLARYDEGGNLAWVFTTDTATNEEFTCVAPHGSTTLSVLERRNTNAFRVRQFDAVTGAPLAVSGRFVTTGTITPESISLNTAATEVYVIGSYTGSLTVGATVYTSAGLSDIFYMRFTANSNIVAASNFRRMGGTGDEYGHDIHNRYGGVNILIASFTGTAEFFDSNTNPFYVTSAGGYDGLLIAAGSNGQISQPDNVQRVGSTGDDELLRVSSGANNTYEFCVSGYFSGTVDFNGKSAVNSLTSAGGKDGVVAKYNFTNLGGGSAFEYGWANKLGGTADDKVEDVSKFSATSNAYFTASLGSGTGTAVQIGAYSSTGTSVTFGGLFFPANQTTVNVPRGVVALSTGEVYTSGIFNASTDFDPSNGTFTIAPVSGGNNAFVHKMSSCTPAAAPAITASRDTVCTGYNDTLRVTGALSGNNKWVWYSGTCGGTFVDTGAVIVVTPTANTSYYVRAEGGCAANGACSAVKTITVKALPPAPVVLISGPATVCASDQPMYALIINNLTAPYTYQWRKNGTNISGANSSVYYPPSVANNDIFSCIVTGATACGTIESATSNNLTVTVTPSAAPIVTIATANSTVCNNTNVTFTSTIANGGTTPGYQWLRNNVPIAGATSATLVINSVNLGSTVNITCVLTSSLACASPTKDTSNVLNVTVTPSVVPSVLINANSTTVCATSTVTLTASPTNGGTSPTYTWQKNNVTIPGATSTTYNASSISNGDVFRCIMVSNAQCAVPSADTSNTITITVTPAVTPSVVISATSTTICAGTSVTFTATPTNGGTTPTYQWKKNGTDINGATSATYTTTTLAHNDVITCVLATSATCYTVAGATSNAITMSVSSSVVPSVTISTPNTTICSNASAVFTATPVNGGNAPTYQWRKNGNNISGATAATYTATGVAANDAFSCVMTSNATCAVPTTATSNSVTINVIPISVPSVEIGTGSTTVCAGSSVTFVAITVNAGTSPTYTWKRNGVAQAGSTSPYTFPSLNNGDIISCELTSSLQCASPVSVNSNSITITVSPQVNAGISIAATQTTICAGNSVTFTATPVNGGGNPVYQWRKNGSAISGATSATYTTSTLANGDNFTCDIISNASCIGNANASSNTITISVSTTVVPSLTISTPSTSICAGANVTFTAIPTNGGSSPTYQWKKNGSNIAGATGATFSTSTLANNDAISCVLTSSVTCASPTTATSNTITVTVNPTVAPAVTIATPNATICTGSSITFTATPVNGGASPTYTWRENGVDQGNTTASYTVGNIANGTVVSCVLQSNAACASPVTATSNNITVTVNPQLTPAATITASQTTICAGGSVTFTAAPTNGGSTPAYQWKKNGSNVSGATSATYTASGIADGDVFTCQLTSSETCLATNNVSSNSIAITVSGSVTPSVVITSSGTIVCAGSNVTFNAVPTNGGNAPTYQWFKNNTPIAGATSASYATSNIANNDVFACQLTSSVSCASPVTVNSNNISMNVNPVVTPSITISTSNTTVCAGTPVTITAVVVNGGNAPQYTWTENGSTQGETSNTYTTSGLQANVTIICELVSDAVCATTPNASSNTLNITVTPKVTPQVTITASQSGICNGSSVTFTATPVNGGTQPAYQWYKNGNTISGATTATYTTAALTDGDVISCGLTSSLSCVTSSNAESNTITMTVTGTVTPALQVTTTATTICAGQPTTFTATPVNGGNTPGYQWKKNGQNISGATTATYTATSLTDGDIISCVLTSSVSCASPQTATSNSVTMDVTPSFVPTVSISGTNDTICSTSSVTYTALANGVVSTYQWTVNGVNAVLGNSIAFTPIGVNNGDTIRCIITSAENCANPTQVVSSPDIITVLTPDTLSLQITTAQTTTCAGSAVVFTSTVANSGNNPAYQWSVNGNEINNATNSIYTTTTLSDGDVVACVVTGNGECVANSQAESNSITINIVSSLTASVTISADQAVICQGALAGFTATGVNGGAGATYVWSVNGVEDLLGSGGPQKSFANLNNNDTVRCKLISSESCVTQAEVLSAPLVVTVAALPDVTITVAGSTLSVPASSAHQWYNCADNSSINGATAATYTATASGDYNVIVTNSAGCVDTSDCVNITVIGVDDITAELVSVYPNPFTDNIMISAPGFSKGFTVQVYNNLGEIIKQANSTTSTYAIQLNELVNGLYFVKVSNHQNSFVKRINKQ